MIVFFVIDDRGPWGTGPPPSRRPAAGKLTTRARPFLAAAL
jgi:hypothetical protein